VRVTIRAQNTLPSSWDVRQQDQRSLGTITYAPGFGYLLHAPPRTRLSGVGLGPYASLGEAIRRIGRYMKAECVVIEE